MITPVIFIKGEALDLGEIPSVTIVEKNPFFNDKQGGYTLPLTVPPTQKNRRLLNHPERFQRMNKLQRTIDAMLVTSRTMPASLTVDSITNLGYSLTLSVNEGSINNRCGTKKLSDFDFGEEVYSNVYEIMTHLSRIFEGNQLSDKYMIFPIVVGSQNNAPYQLNYVSINICDDPRDIEIYRYNPSKVHDSTVEHIDGLTVVNPMGYAISPFLRLSFVITKLFEQLGFTFNVASLFRTTQMQNLVILNNVCDAIVRGKISFNQLLPELSAIAFISAIEKQFCGKFITSENSCRFVYFKDIKALSPRISIDNYLIDNIIPGFSLFNKLTIKQKRSIKSSDNKDYRFDVIGFIENHGSTYEPFSKFIATETTISSYDEFYKTQRENILVFDNHAKLNDNPGKNYYAKNLGLVMRRNISGNTATIEPISTIYFDYTSPVDSSVLDEKSIQFDNESLPMMPANIVSRLGKELRTIAMPVFGIGKATPNTKVIDAKKAEKDAKCPLCLCFGYTSQKISGTDPTGLENYAYDCVTFGSPFSYHPETGESIGNISLCIPTTSGIYNQFYHDYATFLKSSNQPITTKVSANMPISYAEPYLLFGQEVYINEAKHNTNQSTIELTLLTAKTYNPIINEDNTSIDL